MVKNNPNTGTSTSTHTNTLHVDYFFILDAHNYFEVNGEGIYRQRKGSSSYKVPWVPCGLPVLVPTPDIYLNWLDVKGSVPLC